ncbi:MAG: nucleotide sugar dehydrogenase [Lentilitoribacter sp.]
MKITVVGTGYVGMSIGVLLSQHNEVLFLDIDDEKIKLINNNQSPVKDDEIESFLSNKNLDLRATNNDVEAYVDADFIIVATPTNYDAEQNSFDTKTVETVLSNISKINPDAVSIVKSTIPIGFTEEIKQKLGIKNVIFSPEFLREGRALYDNLYPSRIIVGEISDRAKQFADLLLQAAISDDVAVILTDSNEAEAIKLFANTYLAMRVAFFNELDSYSAVHGLDTKQIVDGVCLDPRIGAHYNNPSFGYGGYCLPKDTKQLLANFSDTPQNLMQAIVTSNETRISFVTNEILKTKPKIVGIFRLIMKSGSDNFRASSIISVMEKLKKHDVEIVVFEPSLNDKQFMGGEIILDLDQFKTKSDIIVCNRNSTELDDIHHKVYTRDIFGSD